MIPYIHKWSLAGQKSCLTASQFCESAFKLASSFVGYGKQVIRTDIIKASLSFKQQWNQPCLPLLLGSDKDITRKS